jgi:hypothetical protein
MELDLDTYGFGTDSTMYELESKRRDGFIPSSHNCGGFDVLNYLRTESDGDDGDDGEGYLILHGFRFMYEGEKDGVHTLCGYYSQWSEYDVYGMHKASTLAEIEIRFRNTEQLIVELDKFINRAME